MAFLSDAPLRLGWAWRAASVSAAAMFWGEMEPLPGAPPLMEMSPPTLPPE